MKARVYMYYDVELFRTDEGENITVHPEITKEKLAEALLHAIEINERQSQEHIRSLRIMAGAEISDLTRETNSHRD